MVRSRLRTGGVATALVIPLSAVAATSARAASSGPSPQASSCDRVQDEDAFRRVRNEDAALARLVWAEAMLRIALHGVGRSAAPVTCLPKAQQDGSTEATMDAAAHRVLTEISENAEVTGGNRGIGFGLDLTYASNRILPPVPKKYIEGGMADGVKIGDLMIEARSGDGPAMDPAYVAGAEPGAWRQTGSGAPVTSNRGKFKPFAMTSSTQFRSRTPGGSTSCAEPVDSRERFSPAFPACISGHATFAGAWAGMMQRWFGHDFAFTASTEDPDAGPRPGPSPASGRRRRTRSAGSGSASTTDGTRRPGLRQAPTWASSST